MDPGPISYASSRSRRSHRKSRLGCANCKARRVKCDESEPACNNCVRHSIKCDYGNTRRPAVSPVPGQRNIQAPRPKHPTTQYAFISSSQSEFTIPKRARRQAHTESPHSLSPSETESTEENALAPRPFQFTITDMALFHHLSSAEDLKDYIPDQLIRLGFSVHYVLRLLLAVSGFHIQRKPEGASLPQTLGQHADIGVEAERHLRIATTEVANTSPQLHQANTPSLYIASVYIFICSLARGPQLGEYLAFRYDDDVPSLCLFMGVRSILEVSNNLGTSDGISELHYGSSQAASPEIQTDPEEHTESSPCELNNLNTPSELPEYFGPLKNLQAFISSTFTTSDPRHGIYHSSLDLLFSRFDSIHGSSTPPSGPELWPQIFSWLYMLPDVLVHDMQQKAPAALLLMSFFCVLLNELNSVWFIQGWPRHIVIGAFQSLEPHHHIHLSWPLEKLEPI